MLHFISVDNHLCWDWTQTSHGGSCYEDQGRGKIFHNIHLSDASFKYISIESLTLRRSYWTCLKTMMIFKIGVKYTYRIHNLTAERSDTKVRTFGTIHAMESWKAVAHARHALSVSMAILRAFLHWIYDRTEIIENRQVITTKIWDLIWYRMRLFPLLSPPSVWSLSCFD